MTNSIKNLLFAFFVCFLNSIPSFSQDGNIDLTFNTPIHPNAPSYNGFIGTVYATKILSDGKILVYGDLTSYMGTPIKHVIRIFPDGKLDTTFNVGTGPNDVYFGYSANGNIIAEQTDGKIIVAGSFTSFNGVVKNRIVRLNSNGSIDNTFNIGSGADSTIQSVKIQSDGKIICGGYFNTFNGIAKNNLVRLNSNGTIDNTFDIGSGFTHATSYGSIIFAIETQNDGKILIGGLFTNFNGYNIKGIVRLNSNGSIDNSFAIGTGTDEYNKVKRIIYNPISNSIFFGGLISSFNGQPANNIICLNLDGSTNTSFTPSINIGDESGETGILDFAFFNDNKVLVSGDFVKNNNYDLFLYNANGSENNDFHFSNIQSSNIPMITTVAIDNQNGIYAAGYFQNINYTENAKGSIVKIYPDGQTDLRFNPNFGGQAAPNGYAGSARNSLFMSNGKILIQMSGYYNERECRSISIEQDGSVYQPDALNFKNLNLSANTTKKSNNGKLFVGNSFLYKITENGVLDTSYSSTQNLYTPPYYNILINDFIEQSDGKIIIGGNFRLATAYYQDIFRVNSNGAVDNSFIVGTGFGYDKMVNSIALQSDNKIIVGGEFSSYNGTNNINNILRLNSNGSIDNTFSVGSGFNDIVRKIIITSDSKIIVCGKFTSYNGEAAPHMIRLNMNGSIDNSFTSPFPVGDTFTDSGCVIEQPDGKYIVSAYINQVQVLYRLNNDGTLDSTFNNNHTFSTANCYYIGLGYDNITSITLLPGKILLTGCFSYVSGIRRVGVAMLANSVSLSVNESNTTKNKPASIYPNPVKDVFNINSPETFSKIEIYALDGKHIQSQELTDNKVILKDIASGIYIAKLISDNSIESIKFIKK